METLQIKECRLSDMEKIKYISEKTFSETFSDLNTKEDMENYLKENFSYKQIERELNNDGSIFFVAEEGKNTAAYMKVNFDKAQTEAGHANTLEIQRIYVLQANKGKQIGKRLIQKAIEVANNNNLNYLWLGVWENNHSAIKFYEKQGFEKFDTHSFKLGEDVQTDNLMRLYL